jgi:hypothetical protein
MRRAAWNTLCREIARDSSPGTQQNVKTLARYASMTGICSRYTMRHIEFYGNSIPKACVNRARFCVYGDSQAVVICSWRFVTDFSAEFPVWTGLTDGVRLGTGNYHPESAGRIDDLRLLYARTIPAGC